MRMWVVSDLHLEDGVPFDVVPPEFDVLVCAGDVHEGDPARSVSAVVRLAAGRPAVYVLGNHDVWGFAFEEAVAVARDAARGTAVHVLQDDAVTLGGVVFHGATLWTDGILDQPLVAVSDWTGGAPGTPARAYHLALSYPEPVFARGAGVMDRRAKGRDVLAWHERSRDGIEAALDRAESDGSTLVVVTHHGPAPEAMSDERRRGRGVAMSVSDLGHLVHGGSAAAWIHGHLHQSADLVPGYGTRVVCNPRGGARPNPDFDPAKVVEVVPSPTPRP